MKVAILADIHANLPALETVLDHIDSWQPDRVVLAGDVVNRGPRPRECLETVQRREKNDGWLIVRGNHEDYVITQTDPDAPRRGPEFEIVQNSLWTYQQLNNEADYLEKMPFQVSFSEPDGQEFRVVHASMRGTRAGIFPHTSDEALRHLIQPAPAVLCVGHTHRPLIRTIDETLVVNVGSVGAPFDGDFRATYGQLTWHNGSWQVRIIRLDYDRVRAEQDYFTTGFIPEAGDLAKIMLVEFRQARSHIHRWVWDYQEAVLSRNLSMADSVQAYLIRSIEPSDLEGLADVTESSA